MEMTEEMGRALREFICDNLILDIKQDYYTNTVEVSLWITDDKGWKGYVSGGTIYLPGNE